MEELNVKLGADGKELSPELKKAADEFKNYGKSVSQSLAEVAGRVSKSGQSVKAAGVQFQGFSRVLQDAAFGPAAIANNIEQAVHDIRMLKQVSADTGQSIGKTLVQSLAGGGGLNLALGGLTLALSLASFGMSAWTRMFPKNADEVDKTKKKTLEYVDTLDDVRKAQLLGSQNAQEELTTLRLLYSQYTNANLPLVARKKAYKQLQDQYPTYFGNMKFEMTQTDKNKAAYDRLANSILATARAQAARDAIVKKEGVRLDNNEKLVDLETEITEATSKRVAVQQRLNAALNGTGDANERIAANLRSQLGVLLEKENELLSKRRVLVTENNKITVSQVQLEQQVNAQIAKGGELIDTTGDKVDKVKEKIEKVKKTTQEWLDLMFAKGRDKAVAPLSKDNGLGPLESNQKAIQDKLGMQGVMKTREGLMALSAEYDAWLQGIGQSLSQGFGDFFADFVTQGKLSFKSLGDSILGTFKRIISDAITNKLLNIFLNFATGGASGIFGAIAKFVGIKGVIPGFASGVSNFAGGLAYVHKGELLANLSPGTSVIPANVVSGMGSGGSQVFIANSYQRADMIVTSYDRGERQLGRVI